MIVRINLGLANAHSADLSTQNVHDLLFHATAPYADLLDYREVQSEGGDWEPEPIYWVEFEILHDCVDRFKRALESICTVLHEDAIAVAIVSPSIGEGTILFNPNYEGERYDFNLDYFTE